MQYFDSLKGYCTSGYGYMSGYCESGYSYTSECCASGYGKVKDWVQDDSWGELFENTKDVAQEIGSGIYEFSAKCCETGIPQGGIVAVIASVAASKLFDLEDPVTAAISGIVYYSILTISGLTLVKKCNINIDDRKAALLAGVCAVVSTAILKKCFGIPLSYETAAAFAAASMIGQLVRHGCNATENND